MKDHCFVVLSEYGIQRMTKRPGTLKRGEIAVKVALTIPDKCFVEPDVTVSIDIPETAVIRPDVTVQVVEPENKDTPA